MTDGKLAVIGLGSIGSMALWQASRLSDSVTGFEAASPAHGRSGVGGDTRQFSMLYRGNPGYYPILERSEDLWADLEAETGQDILTRCGGLSIGTGPQGRNGDQAPLPDLVRCERRSRIHPRELPRLQPEPRGPVHVWCARRGWGQRQGNAARPRRTSTGPGRRAPGK
jgi:glycine/D-amino acid oxidase-like deaminating enzyme